ncbi:Dihydrolipoamide dehydrogenase of pyruvate dehydrogenase complex [hydrothermal vent metagenome]|uniref:dihydrolipoyl dehydrogenase n=1 Tax=hydrothermal vent metagenome TaxID=652676 RepID=A0A3B0WEN2_9ZZZZ
MSKIVNVEVPDIGDFADVDIIEVLISAGDVIAKEDPLITLESDKASIEIPSPSAGTVKEVLVNVDDKVNKGDLILKMEVFSADASAEKTETSADSKTEAPTEKPAAEKIAAEPTASTFDGNSDLHAEVVVLGSGPGGYTAAFRAADLGKKVILIEKYDSIGGVCLNVGCIPSKALLHTAEIINEAAEMADHGIDFGKPKIDIKKLAGFKNKVIKQLTGGLAGLAKQRKVQIVTGYGKFTSANTIEVTDKNKSNTISFDNAIIAAGSSVFKIPGFPYDDERLMDSTGALELADIPKRLLVIGGGIIGLEMATVYDALGSKVSVVELSPTLIPGCDADLVRPLMKRVKKRYENIWLNSKVTAIDALKKGLKVSFEGKGVPESDIFDRVLLAVGRSPNGKLIDADKAGVVVDERGFISVDKQQRTNVNHIFAIGDVVGQPMLAHKATHEAKTAAEVVSGMKSFFDAKTIPSVAYTDPEISWMGITEEQAKAEGVEYTKGVFPWAASGRSLSIGRNEGITKVLFDKNTQKIIGAGMVGTNAGELIAEAVLALEMGANIEDIALTVHPHPTLSETFNFAAEMAEGTITDLYIPKK